MKKKIIATMFAMSLMLGANTAFAGPECLQATVMEVASMAVTPPAGATNYRVVIECPGSFSDSRAYYLTTDLGEAGYATLLTAMSLKQTVRMKMSLWASGSLVTEIRLNKTAEP